METPNINPNEPSEGEIVSAPAKFKFGIIGLILGIPGFAISVSMAFLFYLIAMVGGGLDIMLTDTQSSTIISTLYCGLFFGIVGGIFGAVGLSRGENKLASAISILLGVPTLCICSVVAFFNILI